MPLACQEATGERVDTPAFKCSLCPHKGTSVSCICPYQLGGTAMSDDTTPEPVCICTWRRSPYAGMPRERVPNPDCPFPGH
jgi:hypothetical protein